MSQMAQSLQKTVKKNHMDIHWHDFTDAEREEPVSKASLKEKASVIGRVGMMFLSCGTGAWRVRSSMNTMAVVVFGRDVVAVVNAGV